MLAIPHDKQLLHVKEAAALLDLDVSTIRRRIAAGELEAVQLGPRRSYRVHREALERFLRPARASGGGAA